MKKFVDMTKPERVSIGPKESIELFSGKDYFEHGFKIKKAEIRLYEEKTDKKHGVPYWLITTLVETDKGSIEMVYEEVRKGDYSLEKTKDLLISNLGISALILRSVIALKSELSKSL